jgi:DNA-directed DNA polymerase III PolC
LQGDKPFPQRFLPHNNIIVIYPLSAIPKTEYSINKKNINTADDTNDDEAASLADRYNAAKNSKVNNAIELKAASTDKLTLQTLYPNEYIGVQLHEVGKLYALPVDKYKNKFIVKHLVTFKNKTMYNVHRLLRAVHNNILLSKQKPEQLAGKQEHFVTIDVIVKAFATYPYLLTQSMQLLQQCSIAMNFDADKNKKTFGASTDDDKELLHKLAMDGLLYRYGKKNKLAKDRVIKELAIIDKLGFNTYFLITWDVIRYAQSRGFFHVGRGSGANSIVAYCLQITDVDPIELDLYFERFLNPYRTSPPDFDLDFSWKDRDEVIDYLFKRYGRHHVTLLGMYSTFQRNAVVRELGKVFGLPKAEIDNILNRYAPKAEKDSIQNLINDYSTYILNLPNHQSIHPGGVLISEESIYNYAVIDMPPKGFGTAQMDMFVAEKVGLYKLDILSQRGLGHIKDAVQLVKQNKGISIDIHDVEKFKKDEKVKLQIQRADTIGCFYIESPAMRQLLRKLRCSDYLTLVAASSIIRPGVSQSGMMKQYIERFHNPAQINYLHPKMEELLKETYGVMVYQEDVIKVAHHFAGLDMGEADILRRAMSGKYRGNKEMQRIRLKFFANCASYGYDEKITTEVWRQIESFSGYSFSKAHSASFAVESYQSLYLKTYHPIEFMVAVINNFGGFYKTEFYVHELKRAGATVLAPCINNSDILTNVQGTTCYIGLTHIQGLEQSIMQTIIDDREKQGPYTSLQNLVDRTNISAEQLNLLVRINALRFTGLNKKELLWHTAFICSQHKPKVLQSTALFDTDIARLDMAALPPLTHHTYEDVLDEMELLGFTLQSPFTMVDADANNYTYADALPNLLGKEVCVLGYHVTTKPVKTVKGELMAFGTFLDAAGHWLDTVHFPASLAAYPIVGRGFYKMRGVVVNDFGVMGINISHLEKVGIKNG